MATQFPAGNIKFNIGEELANSNEIINGHVAISYRGARRAPIRNREEVWIFDV